MESDESQLLLDLKADQHGHGCSQLSMGRHITDQKKRFEPVKHIRTASGQLDDVRREWIRIAAFSFP